MVQRFLLVIKSVTLLLLSHDMEYCIGIKANGRLGNLMMAYAAMVGICTLNHKQPSECAVIANTHSIEAPIQDLHTAFNLSVRQTPCNFVHKFEERYLTLNGREAPIPFDDRALKQPSGTLYSGYYQSYLYHYPHAENVVKSLFTFSDSVKMEASSYIDSIRRKVPKGTRIVGIHIRLGDKFNLPHYDQWGLSLEYYKKAVGIMSNYTNSNMALLFFFGGYFPNRETVETDLIHKMYTTLSNQTRYSFKEEGGNQFVAMQTLSLCDSIITASSSFSWWAAYLSNSAKPVIAPRNIYAGTREKYIAESYYPLSWTLLSDRVDEDRIPLA